MEPNEHPSSLPMPGYDGPQASLTAGPSSLEFFAQINALLDFQAYKDIRTFLKLFLQRARTFLEADSISVYHFRSEKLQLTKLAAIEHGAPFPQHLPLEEFVSPYQPDFWATGMPTGSELQRCARQSHMKFIASHPLGRGQEFFGLVVVGGGRLMHQPLLMAKLQVVSSITEDVLQRHIFNDALQTRIAENARQLEVRSLVYSNIQEGVIVVDAALRVLEMNTPAELMLGYSLNEVQHLPVLDVLVGADGLLEALEVAHAGIETRELGLVSLHRRNGQAFSAHIQTFPIMDARNSLNQIVILVSDESKQEQNRIRAQHLEQRAALGGLSAVFAHEVRNPINNISTAVQLLKVRIPPEDVNYEVLNRIQSDCGRLNTLVDSVLSFSRPIEAKLQRVNICTQMQMLLERWRPRLERLSIHGFLQKPKDDLFIYADPRLVDQIFTNLISNAVEVMEKTGGTISVKVARNVKETAQPQVEVAVTDTGSGIPDDIIDKIFEPFVSTKSKGTGLGLAITKQMVTAQQGTIRVSSFPGGSVFYVSLPEHRGG